MSSLTAVLGALLPGVPLYLVWLAGLGLAVVHWERYPKVSLLLTLGLAILFIQSLAGAVLSTWLPVMLSRRGMMPSRMGVLFAVQGVVMGLVRAVAWGLVLGAVFVRREDARSAQ
jgi:hypothetical protein